MKFYVNDPPEERDLRSRLKRRVISLSVLQRARKSQCARIANLKDGDANTNFFHRRINARRRKNHIHRIDLCYQLQHYVAYNSVVSCDCQFSIYLCTMSENNIGLGGPVAAIANDTPDPLLDVS